MDFGAAAWFVAPSAVAEEDGAVAGNFAHAAGARGAGGGFRGLLGLKAVPGEAFEESEGHECLEAGAPSDMDLQVSHLTSDLCSCGRNTIVPSHLTADSELVGCKAKDSGPSHLMTVSCSDSPVLDAQTLLSCCSMHFVWPLHVIRNFCTHAVNYFLAEIEGPVDLFGSFSFKLADALGHLFDYK